MKSHFGDGIKHKAGQTKKNDYMATTTQFEEAVLSVKRSKKYGRFRVYRRGDKFDLFELVDKQTGKNEVRVELGLAIAVAEILAAEYKGKP